MAKRFIRYPRTRQELRANQDRNDPYVRPARRNLPTAWDDLYVRHEKSWKEKGREKQYRENDCTYGWHEFHYDWFHDIQSRMIARNIMNQLDDLDCFYEDTRYGIKWFGPNILGD
mgnify:CR=1 FL=1